MESASQVKMNLYEKLAAITHDMTAVEKDLDVGTGKSSYKGTSEASVLSGVKPLEEKYRVYSFPYSREIVESKMMKTTGYNGKEGMRLFMRIKTTYRFVDMDEPSQYIDITSYGDGIDSQDKSPGKAMTYSDKYALLKAYKIITGDDPEALHSEDQPPIMGYYNPQRQSAQNQHRQRPAQGYQQTSSKNYQQSPAQGYQQTPMQNYQYQQPPVQNQQPSAPHPADIPPADHPDSRLIKSLVDLVRSKGLDERFILRSAKVSRMEDMSMYDYYQIVQNVQALPNPQQSHLNL